MATKLFQFYTLLKGGNFVTVESLMEQTDTKLVTVMTYVHELRNKYKADIETVRDGKKCIGYVLKNPDSVKVPELRRNSSKLNPKKKLPPELKKVNPFNRMPVAKKSKSDLVVPPVIEPDDEDISSLRAEFGLDIPGGLTSD